MLRAKAIAYFLLILLVLPNFAYAGEPLFHIVKRGETITQIAIEHVGRPLYAPTGALAKIKDLNSKITNLDVIYPGQKIYLPTSETVVSEPPRVMSSVEAEPETSPAAAPSIPACVAPVPEATDKAVSHLGAEIGFDYFRIDSKDKSTGGRAELLSNLNPSMNLNWDLDWNRSWSSRIRFTAQNYKVLEDVGTSLRTIADASATRYGFEFGGVRRWSESSRTGIFFNYEEKVFSHSPTVTSLTIDRVATPAVIVSQEQDLARIGGISLGAGVELAALLPGRGPGYSTEAGYGGKLYTYLEHDLGKFSFKGKVLYGIEQQNTSVAEQSRSNLGAFFGVSWRFAE